MGRSEQTQGELLKEGKEKSADHGYGGIFAGITILTFILILILEKPVEVWWLLLVTVLVWLSFCGSEETEGSFFQKEKGKASHDQSTLPLAARND